MPKFCSRIYIIAIFVRAFRISGQRKISKGREAFKQKRKSNNKLVSNSHCIATLHSIFDHLGSLLQVHRDSYIHSISEIESRYILSLIGCAQVRIRLLSNRASVSLVLCNKSIFRGFHILSSLIGCTTSFIYPYVCFRVLRIAIGLLVTLANL